MAKKLVAFFSASGVTAKLAEKLASAIDADLHEIKPEVSYTTADLDWTNKRSRSSVEMNDRTFRPAVANMVENMNQYSIIYIAFPIWWYIAPTIINTFLEQYDLRGKKIIPIATSGGSGMGNTNKELAPSCAGADLRDGKVFSVNTSESRLKAWAEEYN
ncbi:flavodoxin [Clostridium sp. AF15-17LB]|nr:flavodoxin [Clostridium sp. AF15-17LB]